MISKIVIPAAGKGTRMLDLAKDRPKHLIDVLDKPFLYYVLNNLQQAGFEEMILVVGHHAEKMEAFARNEGSIFPLTVVNQFEVMGTEKYGTAIPVLAAQKAVGDESFVCIYGDNLYSVRDLQAIRALKDGFNYLNIIHSDTPEKYGVPIMDGDRVAGLVEKPKTFISNWVAVGCYALTPEIFAAAAIQEPSERGEYELTRALSDLAAADRVRVRKMLDFRLDFGSPKDVEAAADLIRANKLNH